MTAMPLFKEYRQAGLRIGVWKMEETTGQLLALLDDRRDVYAEEVKKYTSEARRCEWLAVRVLLKALCGGEEKEIAYFSSGKPYLKEREGFVSISHTRGYVAVALHPDYEVGIDIEQYGERVKKVSSRFMRPDEMPATLVGDEVYALLLHWSAKETLFKVIGEVGVDFLHHLHILPFVPVEAGSFEAREYRTEAQRRYRVHYLTHPDFVLTWTVKE